MVIAGTTRAKIRATIQTRLDDTYGVRYNPNDINSMIIRVARNVWTKRGAAFMVVEQTFSYPADSESVTLAGASPSFQMIRIEDITNPNSPIPLRQIDISDKERYSRMDGQPGYSIFSDASGLAPELKFAIYPKPSSNRTIKMVCSIPPGQETIVIFENDADDFIFSGEEAEFIICQVCYWLQDRDGALTRGVISDFQKAEEDLNLFCDTIDKTAGKTVRELQTWE